MLNIRIIPTLQLINKSLVKTKRFGDFQYIGDPINTVRIFNELEVDELCVLDIRASKERRGPNFALLNEVASECFMPLSYGGGITNIDEARKIFSIGFEKIILNTSAHQNPGLVTQISNEFGSQSIIISIDFKSNFFGKFSVHTHSGTKNTRMHPLSWALKVEELGAGEILLTDIKMEGTWGGINTGVTSLIADAVNVPVIAHGGAGTIDDISQAINNGKASAVAIGSMVVYQKKDMGVLVNFPDKDELKNALEAPSLT